MLRTLRACGVSARMLNAVLVVELVSLALIAGLIGLVCGYLIAAALLPDVAASLRGLYGAQIPGQLTLKPEWWIAGIAISIIGALAAAATSLTKALRLPLLAAAQPYAWQQAQRRWLIFQSALALAVFAAAGVLLLVRRFADLGLCRARGVAARRGADPADVPGTRAVVRPATCAKPAAHLVLGRQPPATIGIVAGADGAAARARGQCRRRHHGRKLQPHLSGLARRTAGGGRLCQRRQTTRRPPRSRAWLRERPEVEAILPGGRADTQIAGAPIEVLGLPDHATYRGQLAAAAIGRQCLDQASSRRRLPRQRTIGAAAESFASATASKCRRRAATGRWKSSASMPITATRKARSRSISPR